MIEPARPDEASTLEEHDDVRIGVLGQAVEASRTTSGLVGCELRHIKMGKDLPGTFIGTVGQEQELCRLASVCVHTLQGLA